MSDEIGENTLTTRPLDAPPTHRPPAMRGRARTRR